MDPPVRRPAGPAPSPAAVALMHLERGGPPDRTGPGGVLRALVTRAVHERVLARRQDLNQDLAVRTHNVRTLATRGGRSTTSTGG